jgi:protocatechuate 3,4-dioxygenase beta subunit
MSLIENGMPGTPILIIGRVFDQDCQPIPGAKLDFWLADVNGEYDNVGYRLRGHLFTDDSGNYALESIEPTPYTGRPPHIHVKVFAPDGNELLTTQMYFTGSEGSSDVTASPDLLVEYLGLDENGRKLATFNFIVKY